MDLKSETRLAVARGRASEVMLSDSTSEDSSSPIERQVAFFAGRYGMDPWLARVFAENCFRVGPLR